MDLIDGKHLDEYVRENELSRRQILALLQTVAQAVQHAHQRGVIHRDLKPSNILVSKDGQPHVVDFGLAKTALAGESAVTVYTTHILCLAGFRLSHGGERDAKDVQRIIRTTNNLGAALARKGDLDYVRNRLIEASSYGPSDQDADTINRNMDLIEGRAVGDYVVIAGGNDDMAPPLTPIRPNRP